MPNSYNGAHPKKIPKGLPFILHQLPQLSGVRSVLGIFLTSPPPLLAPSPAYLLVSYVLLLKTVKTVPLKTPVLVADLLFILVILYQIPDQESVVCIMVIWSTSNEWDFPLQCPPAKIASPLMPLPFSCWDQLVKKGKIKENLYFLLFIFANFGQKHAELTGQKCPNFTSSSVTW